MAKTELIEVYASGDPVTLVHEVAPAPIRKITKDKRVKVYARSGIIQRLLKSGELLTVRPPPPPAKSQGASDKDPDKSKGKSTKGK